MKPPSLVEIQREIGLRGSFHAFVKMAWPTLEPTTPFVDNWHVEEVCKALEEVFRGECLFLVVNVPPGHMKSILVSILWCAWCWIRDPGWRAIYASYDQSLTGKKQGGDLIEFVRSDWFRERWGDRVMFPTDSPAMGDFETLGGGWRFATSIRGRLTGRHGDVVVVDDPIKPKGLSKVALDECKEWWRGTASTRFRNPMKARKVIIMQRLHEDDLAGLAAKQGARVLRFPARFEPGDACPEDRRTEPGELLWPARFPEEALASLEEDLGPQGAAAQLQQRPSPEGGLVFQRPWLGQRFTIPPAFDQVLQSWDLTFKDGVGSDFVVGQVWGRKGAGYYLLDQVRARMSFTATLQAIKDMRAKWPRAMTILVEDKANGSAVIDTLSKQIPGIIAVNPEGGKVARANAVAPLFQAGNVHLVEAPWVGDYVEEFASFPTGAHDDQVDATTQALAHLYAKASSFAAAMARLASEGL